MHRPTRATLALLAASAVLVPTAATAAGPHGGPHGGPHPGRPAYTFAVIGDVPYGDPAQAAFPAFIAGINDDPDVQAVTHLGDIKSGSTTCDDQRFAAVRRDFDLFADPLHYTPGDNEWTDCHRANNGGYQPLERLAQVRQLFFSPAGPHPGSAPAGHHAGRERLPGEPALDRGRPVLRHPARRRQQQRPGPLVGAGRHHRHRRSRSPSSRPGCGPRSPTCGPRSPTPAPTSGAPSC